MKPAGHRLQEHYEAADRQDLARQGAQFLGNHAGLRVKRAKARLWLLAWIVMALVGVAIGGFYLWVLYQAKVSGAKFSDLRNESIKVLSTDGDD